MGLCDTVETAPASVPKIALVGAAEDHYLFDGDGGGKGKWMRAEEVDLLVRAISVEQPHRAVPITVAMALAVAAEVRGSVVEGCLKERGGKDGDEGGKDGGRESNGDGDGKVVGPGKGKGKEIVIGHPTGKIMVGTRWEGDGVVGGVSVFRTARRLMAGDVYWR